MLSGAPRWQHMSSNAAAFPARARNSTTGSLPMRRAGGVRGHAPAQPAAYQAVRVQVVARAPQRVGRFEGRHPRSRMAWLAVRSAWIRLTIPEAYAVHRQIIERGARYREDTHPDQAICADPRPRRAGRAGQASAAAGAPRRGGCRLDQGKAGRGQAGDRGGP